MKKLISVDLQRLRHAEFGQLIVRFFEDFSASSLDARTDPDFKRLLDHIQAQISTYNIALDEIRATEETSVIAEADAVRNVDLQALKEAVKPYRYAKTQTEKDAYIAIKLLLDQCKNVQNTSYEEETARLDILVEKLLSPEYSFQISALSIVKFANHLSDSNSTFNTIFAECSYQTSQKQMYDVKALRKILTHDYKQMANYIVTLACVKNESFYNDVLTILNKGRMCFSTTVQPRRNNHKRSLTIKSNS